MSSRTKLSDADTLELYRVALENATNQPEIAALMAELGYNAATIAAGKQLLTQTRAAFDANKTEVNQSSAAHAAFIAKKDEIEETYSLHRKKAKVAFRTDPVLLKQLNLDGAVPKAHIKWVETMKALYAGSDLTGVLQAKLAALKVTPADFQAALQAIAEMENLRAVYLKEEGESQEATKAKDEALAKMDEWMSEFYAVARIALEDKPQLLETLGKVVRN